METRRRTFVKVVLVLLAALALAPSGSQAATVRERTVTNTDPHNGVTTVTTLEYTAAAGEANQLSVTVGSSGAVQIVDTGATISAGPGCSVAAGAATCGAADQINVSLGNRDDRATTTVPAGRRTFVAVTTGSGNDIAVMHGPLGGAADGGAGNDILVGTEAGDSLAPGPGVDVVHAREGPDTIEEGDAEGPVSLDLLDGGAGVDDVGYRERTAAVRIDLRADRGGEPGENDVLTSIEDAGGGDGDDRIIGDSRANSLDDGGAGADRIAGGGGDDSLFFDGRDRVKGGSGDDEFTSGETENAITRIFGGRGNDVIDGGFGRDRVKGGPGRDRISGGDGRDHISGGPGRDRIDGGGGRDRLAGNSARDRIFGGSGRDTLLARDGTRDRVSGGSGRDRAQVDLIDRVRRVEVFF